MSPRSVTAEVKPELLIWARETAGLEVSEVARRLRKVETWERGDEQPTVSQLEKLSDLYKRPLAAFFLPAPPQEPPLPTDFRVLPSDEPRKLSRRVRLAMRRARRIQRIYGELSRELSAATPVGVPRVRVSDDPEERGALIRRALGITFEQQLGWLTDRDAFATWRSSVEALGVLVLQLTVPVREARGFSLSDGPVPTIVVSSSDAVPARIFSLFHELGHLMLNTGGVCLPDPRRDPNADIEQFCNALSGAVLVPLAALRTRRELLDLPDDPDVVDARLTSAARDFKASRYVILRRLLAGQHIVRPQFRRTMDRWEREELDEPRRQRRGGAVKPAVQTIAQLGTHFVSLVLEAHTRNTITSSDVSDYLSLRLKHLPAVQSLIAAQAHG
jgi:Zn-dependent peptidase ImmA (M78 family)/transcriptional regulator with XRE-family HTH domain